MARRRRALGVLLGGDVGRPLGEATSDPIALAAHRVAQLARGVAHFKTESVYQNLDFPFQYMSVSSRSVTHCARSLMT